MPSATARQFQRAARQLGFERRLHPDARSVTIPLHGGRAIGPPLYHKILRQLGIGEQEFGQLR